MRQVQLQQPGIENLVLAEVEQPEPGPGRWLLLFVIRPCVFVEWQISLIRFGWVWRPLVSVSLVPGARLELARPFGQRILSP